MGRKVVDATNAWRMRRTRGDIGRCFFDFAWAGAGAVFLAGACVPVVLLGVADDFVCEDLWFAGLSGTGAALSVCLLEVGEAAGVEAC